MVALNISSLPKPHASASRPAPSAACAARAAASAAAAEHDAILVSRFNAGDERAFTEIVARYHAKMVQVALRRLGNHADAEEIAQDTFIRAHRSLGTFRGDSSLSAWLYRITLNLSHNRHWYFFRRRRHATRSLDATFSESNTATIADVLPGHGPTPVQEAATSEFVAIVTSCLGQLPPGQRDLLALRAVQQHSYTHISRLLGIGLGTAKSRIARARASLRQLVRKSYPEFGTGAPSIACFEALRSTVTVPLIECA